MTSLTTVHSGGSAVTSSETFKTYLLAIQELEQELERLAKQVELGKDTAVALAQATTQAGMYEANGMRSSAIGSMIQGGAGLISGLGQVGYAGLGKRSEIQAIDEKIDTVNTHINAIDEALKTKGASPTVTGTGQMSPEAVAQPAPGAAPAAPEAAGAGAPPAAPAAAPEAAGAAPAEAQPAANAQTAAPAKAPEQLAREAQETAKKQKEFESADLTERFKDADAPTLDGIKKQLDTTVRSRPKKAWDYVTRKAKKEYDTKYLEYVKDKAKPIDETCLKGKRADLKNQLKNLEKAKSRLIDDKNAKTQRMQSLTQALGYTADSSGKIAESNCRTQAATEQGMKEAINYTMNSLNNIASMIQGFISRAQNLLDSALTTENSVAAAQRA